MIAVLLTHTLSWRGGAERMLVEAIRAWPEERDVLHVVSLDPDDAGRRLESKTNVFVHVIQCQRPWYYPGEFFRCLSRLRGIARRTCAEVIHAQFFDLGVLAALGCHARPRVVRLQNGTLFPTSPYFRAELGPVGRARHRVFAMIMRRCHPTAYVAISSFLADVAARALGAKASEIEIVHNGLDVSAVTDAAPPPVESEQLRVCCLGRFIPFKRHDFLLRAVADASRRVPISLRLVGGGPLEHPYRRLAAKLGVETSVSIEPKTEDPLRVFRWSDLLAMTSLGEGFGLVCIEAMACGRPVVAWRGSSFPEIVDDGKTGILVEEGDVVAMADALVKLAGDRALLRAMGKAARRRAEEHFSIERSAGKLRAILASAASARDLR